MASTGLKFVLAVLLAVLITWLIFTVASDKPAADEEPGADRPAQSATTDSPESDDEGQPATPTIDPSQIDDPAGEDAADPPPVDVVDEQPADSAADAGAGPSAPVLGQAGTADVPLSLAPEEFVLGEPRLRTIPPVNAAQLLTTYQPPADERFAVVVRVEVWQQAKLISEHVLRTQPAADGGAAGAHVEQWGLDVHRADLLEPDQEPRINIIWARKLGRAVVRGSADVSPPTDATRLTFVAVKPPEGQLAGPKRVVLLVAVDGKVPARQQEGVSAADAAGLIKGADFAIRVVAEVFDSKAEAESAPATDDDAGDAAAGDAAADDQAGEASAADDGKPLPPVDMSLSDQRPQGSWYVSPHGQGDGNGSPRHPLPLAQAIGISSPVQPGESILLMGGRYEGWFKCSVSGSEGKPITIRPAGDEPVTLVSVENRLSTLVIRGRWIDVQNLELTNSSPRAMPAEAADYPGDIVSDSDDQSTFENLRGAGVAVAGGNVRLQGLRIHDCGDGIVLSVNAAPVEVRGCIIYNNGHFQLPGPRGAGIRLSNRRGTKIIRDNIIFNQFGPGIQAFSDIAEVSSIDVSGNVVFGSGGGAGLLQPNIIVGSESSEAGKVNISENIFWQFSGLTASFGSTSLESEIRVRDNLFRGKMQFRLWRSAEVRGNTFIGRAPLVSLHLPARVKEGSYTWNKNRYFLLGGDMESFASYAEQEGGGVSWSQWRKQNGFDDDSDLSEGNLGQEHIQIRSMGDDGRWAYVAAVAAEGQRPEGEQGDAGAPKATVQVDLSSVLPEGARFRVYNLEDTGRKSPLVDSLWRGEAVELPLVSVKPPASAAGQVVAPRPSGPYLQVYLVERVDAPVAAGQAAMAD